MAAPSSPYLPLSYVFDGQPPAHGQSGVQGYQQNTASSHIGQNIQTEDQKGGIAEQRMILEHIHSNPQVFTEGKLKVKT